MFIKDGNKVDLQERDATDADKINQRPLEESVNFQNDGIVEEKLKIGDSTAPSELKKKPALKAFLKKHVHPSNDKDDLLDIHVGNPLRRITEILEDIKKQKAFSFTLKGSLGIMGVALALSTFGFFGGSKALCDKGTQSYIGSIRQLAYSQEESIPWLTQLADAHSVLIGGRPHEKPTTHLLLIQQDNTTINLQIDRAFDRGGPVPQWFSESVARISDTAIVTGHYDACSRTLTINHPSAIEQR